MDLEVREALALSEDRAAALSQLLPGSEEHDYYRALHAQHVGQLAEAQQIIDAWPQRHGSTQRYQRIKFRQLICHVLGDPAKYADTAATELGASRWHTQLVEHADPTRPTQLPAGSFDGAKLLAQASAADSSLAQVTDEGLLELLELPLDASRRRALLQRIHHSPSPRLVDLVVEDLAERDTPGFGSLPAHAQLTLPQLKELGQRRDELRAHLGWVAACIVRMRPHHAVDLGIDRAARLAFLTEVWAFVAPLPAALNTLKAHVLWHLLDTQRCLGPIDSHLAHVYVTLPRTASYLASEWTRSLQPAEIAQHGSDLRAVTGLPPAGSDEALVRELLYRDLARAERYRPYLDSAWLDSEIATATLLSGTGDADRATRELGPARAQELRERVELAWAPTAPAYFAANAVVVLEADVKNVPELVVKVFRIDPVAYFHHHQREVNTDLDLDGLAASHERTIACPEPAVRRVRRGFELPECARPGTYVIDLIGNGRSSRALVNKGRLRHVTRIGAAGHVVAILDEDGVPRPDAKAWIGEREYGPDEHGVIVVPFSTAPGRTPILLVAAELTTVGSIELVSEQYTLELNLVVDREALATSRPVTAIARVKLAVAGMPASLAILTNPTWDVTLTDRHGVATTKSQPLALTDDDAAILEWPMPEEVATVEVTVRGRVMVRSEQRELEVAASQQVELAAIHSGIATEALYLADTAAGWVLSALGKTGEPRPARAVTTMLVHRWARTQLDVELGTDAAGRIELGALPGVEWISATLNGVNQPWLAGDVGIGATLAVAAGKPVVVSIPPRRTAAEVLRRMSLVELRAGVPTRHPEVTYEALASAIAIHGLTEGEYELRGPGLHVAISVAGPGPEVQQYAIAANEVLQTPRLAPAIAAIEVDDQAVRIQLRGATARTRAHVIGTRFLPAFFDPIPLGPATAPVRRLDRARGSYYVSGRELGDEYRYVLERKGQKKWPSLLLDKPSLLLNPWARRTTQTAVAQPQAGGAFGASAMPSVQARGGGVGTGLLKAEGSGHDDYATFDFVALPPAVLANLVPDANGLVTIARDALGAAVTLVVLVDDPAGATRRHVAFPERAVVPRDLRLRIALDPERHAQQTKAIAPLQAGETLAIEDLATAQVHVLDSLDKAHAYLLALRDDATLRDFAFVTKWHALADRERRDLYSKYACHELHLFLYFKDQPFFDAVIAPYLAHKRRKTFLDEWLLGTDLAAWFEPARFEALNAVERALLALRRPADSALPRLLADRVATMAPDPALDTRIVDALLGASALDGDEGIASAMDEASAAYDARAGSREAPVASPMAAMAMPAPPPAPARRMMAKESAKAKRSARSRADDDDEQGATPEAAPSELDFDRRARAEPQVQHFRAVDKTQEWAETNWWRKTPRESTSELIAVNRLWRDLAQHGRDHAGLLSRWLGLATSNFAEAMCALAVTELPFVAAKHDLANVTGPRGAGLAITARSAALVGTSQIVDGEVVAGGAPLVVGASYVRADDRSEWIDGESHDKYVETFVAGVVYTCLVVLANPTSTRQRIAALVQIPRGSIAVANGRATQTLDVLLAPYGTHGHEYSFYFPQAGQWSHYPVHVSRGGVIVAATAPRVLDVLAKAEAEPGTAWTQISQRGSLAEVVAFIATENLAAIDLDLIAWRLRDPDAYSALLPALEARHIYRATLWGYAFVHRDVPRIAQWLRATGDLLQQGGPAHELLAFDTEDTGAYEYLEFAPLVNARAHRLGGKLRILNDGLAQQFDRFLELVAHRPAPLAQDLLAAAAYYLAQDRVDEATAALARVEAAGPRASALPEQMQHDYLAAYVACLHADVPGARQFVERWRELPVPRWRTRFDALRSMLDEASGAATVVVDPANRNQQQAAAAAAQPTFELEVDREGIAVTSQHLKALELRFFEMDVELLFSRQPFVQSDVSRFSFIEPGARERIVDPPPETKLPWPAALKGKHVVVEGVGAGQRRAKVHYSNDLVITVANQLGQVRAVRTTDRKPLATVYVKVYARKRGGAVEFYKDGYTDLRGWFDYASLSTTDLDSVERFALLIASETAGAAIVEAAPPQR